MSQMDRDEPLKVDLHNTRGNMTEWPCFSSWGSDALCRSCMGRGDNRSWGIAELLLESMPNNSCSGHGLPFSDSFSL